MPQVEYLDSHPYVRAALEAMWREGEAWGRRGPLELNSRTWLGVPEVKVLGSGRTTEMRLLRAALRYEAEHGRGSASGVPFETGGGPARPALNPSDVVRAGRAPEAPGRPVPRPGPGALASTPGPRTSRLTTAEERRRRPEPVWAIDQLVPEWGVGQLFGASFTGKTYVALDLSLSVANGLDAWAGHAIRRPGPVVYVAMEGVFDLQKRVDAWLGAHKGCTDSDLLTLEEEAVDLADAASVGLLREDVRLAGVEPALIVVDTQSLATPGTDENSNTEMNRVFSHMKALASELRCPVMLVHHTGHTAQDRSRGASAIFAALDFQFRVMDNQLSAPKVKAGRERGPWGVVIQTGRDGSAYATVGSSEGAMAVVAAAAQSGAANEDRHRIRVFLTEHGEATAARVREMLGTDDVSESTVKRRLRDMAADGLVERVEGGHTGVGRAADVWRLAGASE